MSKQFFEKAVQTGKKIGKIFRMTEMPLNRKMVGKDRLGNSYFQHYDDNGFETKRECVYLNDYEKFRQIGEDSIDPFWSEWMAKRQKKPYTEEELKTLYREYDMRQNRYKYEKQSFDQQSNQNQNYNPNSWKN